MSGGRRGCSNDLQRWRKAGAFANNFASGRSQCGTPEGRLDGLVVGGEWEARNGAYSRRTKKQTK